MGSPRWPLHPQPGEWERLEDYRGRRAQAYGVGYDVSLRRALGRHGRGARDIEGAGFNEVAARLSAGTGVPVERLRDMQGKHVMARLVERAHASAGTLEKQQAMDALREAMRYVLRRIGTHPSQ